MDTPSTAYLDHTRKLLDARAARARERAGAADAGGASGGGSEAPSPSWQRIAADAEELRGELRDLALDLHDHPEEAFEEHHAAAALAQLLRAHGHRVETGVGGLPTALRAVAQTPGGGTSESGSARGEAAVAAARTQLGTPYVWGGTQPGGFDCSGLTQWAYRQAGVEIPRTAEEQAVGRAVSAEELQPGDLAVWDGHVAMYAGDGQMIEAGDPVQTNPVRTSNMGMTFKGFYRPTG